MLTFGGTVSQFVLLEVQINVGSDYWGSTAFTNSICCGETKQDTHHSRHPCCHPCWQGSPRVCVVGSNCYTCPVHCLQTPDGNGLSDQTETDPFQLNWHLGVNLLYLAVEALTLATDNIHTNTSEMLKQ
jgi:hypothetical protein